jgi:predicted metal-dependent hydrolase
MNIEIKVDKIIRNKNRKSIKIEISNGGFITLRVPEYATNEDIISFLEYNYNWIESTLNKVSTQPVFVRQYRENEKFMFLGKEYSLHIYEADSPKFKFDGYQFIVSKSVLSNAQHYFECFYKLKAKIIIKQRVIDIANKLEIKFKNLRITSADSRWGSCNSEGNVNFSWRLIMATPSAIDYVIIHEFCHLFEFNHSPRFWQLVEKIMPDYKIHKKWLADNSKHMML